MREQNDSLLKLVKQFCSYFCVGGVSALVEWACFYLFYYICGLWYAVATVAAFVFSTLTNYVLGRLWTFRAQSQKKSLREVLAVYAVSAVGLVFNLILMYLLVDIAHLPAMLSKVAATGLVFIWNFLSRKLFIYKETKEEWQ